VQRKTAGEAGAAASSHLLQQLIHVGHGVRAAGRFRAGDLLQRRVEALAVDRCLLLRGLAACLRIL
jgi:hypothetical protein